MVGSFTVRQSKTILARSCEAGRAFQKDGNETATENRSLVKPWILSPARLPIPPRRRGQEHTHFARRDEHFDWPGTQAASHCCTGTQSFSRYCLREKNLDTSQRSGRHFGMSGTRAKFNQAAERGCPACCFEDSCGDG